MSEKDIYQRLTLVIKTTDDFAGNPAKWDWDYLTDSLPGTIVVESAEIIDPGLDSDDA